MKPGSGRAANNARLCPVFQYDQKGSLDFPFRTELLPAVMEMGGRSCGANRGVRRRADHGYRLVQRTKPEPEAERNKAVFHGSEVAQRNAVRSSPPVADWPSRGRRPFWAVGGTRHPKHDAEILGFWKIQIFPWCRNDQRFGASSACLVAEGRLHRAGQQSTSGQRRWIDAGPEGG
nr:hypothetical protein CFP56_11531 [Quercus suber]